jgi:hypothetical protein
MTFSQKIAPLGRLEDEVRCGGKDGGLQSNKTCTA